MIHQVMFSGNVRRDVSIVKDREEIERICKFSENAGFTGLSIYTEGTFLTLFEGDKDKVKSSIITHKKIPTIGSIMEMVSRDIENRFFTDFKMGLRRKDSIDAIDQCKQTFELTPENLEDMFPENLPQEFKLLFQTFSRINRLVAT